MRDRTADDHPSLQRGWARPVRGSPRRRCRRRRRSRRGPRRGAGRGERPPCCSPRRREAQVVDEPGALFLAAGDPDHLRPLMRAIWPTSSPWPRRPPRRPRRRPPSADPRRAGRSRPSCRWCRTRTAIGGSDTRGYHLRRPGARPPRSPTNRVMPNTVARAGRSRCSPPPRRSPRCG